MTAPHAPLEIFDDTGIHRVLCVVAHPDDMEYGGSAAVAEWTSRGVEVAYLLLTAGEAGIRDRAPEEVGPLRAEEQRDACAIVGVDQLTILDFPDGLVPADISVREAIARRIREFRPDAVVAQTWELEARWGLNHVDHRHTGIATVDALRDADNPWVFREQTTEDGLEAWATKWLLVTGPAGTHAVPLSEASVKKGIASLEAHKVYLAALPDHMAPGEMINQITADGGAAAGVERALPVRAIRMG
ncbi:PIG-L deacetylase family protein [Tomitella fengzijianii]|uniref:PIG-L family deacetylase n=1 Tax=Tomitella fengzijianii TaxID=2597660 RepID=A0A516X283_9ACTN|nr:PIG-L deacetylase family protein [Tomitella fengzijianii]QDQ97194.1 PIG-L family deacetylase [Tomitella fengzijianii]